MTRRPIFAANAEVQPWPWLDQVYEAYRMFRENHFGRYPTVIRLGARQRFDLMRGDVGVYQTAYSMFYGADDGRESLFGVPIEKLDMYDWWAISADPLQ